MNKVGRSLLFMLGLILILSSSSCGRSVSVPAEAVPDKLQFNFESNIILEQPARFFDTDSYTYNTGDIVGAYFDNGRHLKKAEIESRTVAFPNGSSTEEHTLLLIKKNGKVEAAATDDNSMKVINGKDIVLLYDNPGMLWAFDKNLEHIVQIGKPWTAPPYKRGYFLFLTVNPVLSPDNQKIAYTSNRRTYPEDCNTMDLWLADLNGNSDVILENVDGGPIGWLSDDEILLHDMHLNWHYLYVYNYKLKTKTVLLDNASIIEYGANNDYAVYCDDSMNWYRFNLKSKESKKIDLLFEKSKGDQTHSFFSYSGKDIYGWSIYNQAKYFKLFLYDCQRDTLIMIDDSVSPYYQPLIKCGKVYYQTMDGVIKSIKWN